MRDDGFAYTESFVLTEEGVVLGEYVRFSGMSSLGLRAFWWTRDSGLHDLGDLTDMTGWDRLTSAGEANGTTFSGAPFFIGGHGLTTNQIPGYGETSFLMTAQLPEPSGTAALLLIAPALCRRRRR
jgi:hypothetical protein